MKMTKLFWFTFLAAIVISCNESKTENIDDELIPEVKLTFEERVNRHVTGSLSIPVTEKFTTQRYNAHLNADNSEDAIITINRLEYARSQAAKVSNGKQIEEMGFMGNNNYFIFYDGKLDKFSVPVSVPSSAISPLEVKFDNLLTESYKDLTIEYRILNSAYRNYYTLAGGILQKVFQVKLFDYIGIETPEAFYIEYDKGSISSAKDILVYEGKIKNYQSDIKDVFTYVPEIQKKEKLLFRWFFNPKSMQYMTQNVEALRQQSLE